MALGTSHHWYVFQSLTALITVRPVLTFKSPVCSKKGNKRCIKLRHLIECDTHRGKYHSIRFGCVSCAEACARKERANRLENDQLERRGSAEDEKKQHKNNKRGKAKAAHEKTMKQLKKELREEKRASSGD
jgi:hypothetical protein